MPVKGDFSAENQHWFQVTELRGLQCLQENDSQMSASIMVKMRQWLSSEMAAAFPNRRPSVGVNEPQWWFQLKMMDSDQLERSVEKMLAVIWGLLVEGLGHGLSSHVWWRVYAEDLGSGLPWRLGLRGVVDVSPVVMFDSFVTSWTIAHWAPPSMGFPRQEY